MFRFLWNHFVFFIFFPASTVQVYPHNGYFTWTRFQHFTDDWALQNSSTSVKVASKPSDISQEFFVLDENRYSPHNDVWGIWRTHFGNWSISYKLDTAKNIYFCGISNVSLSIKYYSEAGNWNLVKNCLDSEGLVGNCMLPTNKIGEYPKWNQEVRNVSISEEIVEFEFISVDGQPVIIDQVRLDYTVDQSTSLCKQREEEYMREHNIGIGAPIIETSTDLFKNGFKKYIFVQQNNFVFNCIILKRC